MLATVCTQVSTCVLCAATICFQCLYCAGTQCGLRCLYCAGTQCVFMLCCQYYVDSGVYVVYAATKGFVSRHVLTPCQAASESHPDLLSWNDPPPRYTEKPTANDLLSMLDPLSASSNQQASPMATKSGSSADLKSTGVVDSDNFMDSHVSSSSSRSAG